jgi:hypothetical protein
MNDLYDKIRMKARFSVLLIPILVFVTVTSASAQPTITGITATGGGAYGGPGPNSGGPWTITGTGFVDTVASPKAVRFVDAANNDIFTTAISCTVTTTCTAFSVRPYRVAAGAVQTIQVFALVNGVKSPTGVNFVYYGPPIVTSVVPPVKGDYDGDGRTDLALYVVSTGNWNILLSGANYTTSLSKPLGGPGYLALPKYP